MAFGWNADHQIACVHKKLFSIFACWRNFIWKMNKQPLASGLPFTFDAKKSDTIRIAAMKTLSLSILIQLDVAAVAVCRRRCWPKWTDLESLCTHKHFNDSRTQPIDRAKNERERERERKTKNDKISTAKKTEKKEYQTECTTLLRSNVFYSLLNWILSMFHIDFRWSFKCHNERMHAACMKDQMWTIEWMILSHSIPYSMVGYVFSTFSLLLFYYLRSITRIVHTVVRWFDGGVGSQAWCAWMHECATVYVGCNNNLNSLRSIDFTMWAHSQIGLLMSCRLPDATTEFNVFMCALVDECSRSLLVVHADAQLQKFISIFVFAWSSSLPRTFSCNTIDAFWKRCPLHVGRYFLWWHFSTR